MTKTQKELNTLKAEYETIKAKLYELSEEELSYVTGGVIGNCHHKNQFAYRDGYVPGGSLYDCDQYCVHHKGGDGGCDLD